MMGLQDGGSGKYGEWVLFVSRALGDFQNGYIYRLYGQRIRRSAPLLGKGRARSPAIQD
jgi:hypothetical protein